VGRDLGGVSVLVAGAGLAGLSAARDLLALGATVTVVDSRDRVGGRVLTIRDGFVESDYWRHYSAFYAAFERMHQKYPDLVLQQASGGGTRLDLATAHVFQEQFTSDPPQVLHDSSGISMKNF